MAAARRLSRRKQGANITDDEPTARDTGRVRIARHLSTHEPVPGDALPAAVGLTVEQFWVVINHPWFDLTGKGYVLTEAGRAESAD